MNYGTLVFVVFFIFVFLLYYLATSLRGQVLVLIIASLFFYCYENPGLIAVFISSWLITGVCSYVIMFLKNCGLVRIVFFVGVSLNVFLLAFFKYKVLLFSAFGLKLNDCGGVVNWLVALPLPIGISFYTFHGISLIVDVYRGNVEFIAARRVGLVRHLLETLLYLVFFPQLIAGPIIKAKDFYPQVAFKLFKNVDFTASYRALVLGFFLKNVIADNLSEQTFWISYPYFESRSSLDKIILLYGYSAQIFADFAGYSLIAIGLAKLLGFQLPNNFNFPYLSSSISEFWRRWHISLSSWLRDYIYIPIGGNKKGVTRTYINLLIVMLIGGVWHGAAMSFVFWGLWHGVGLIIERPFLNKKIFLSDNHLIFALRVFLVFNFVSIGWLFFKLQDFSQAWSYLFGLICGDAGGIGVVTDKMNVVSILFYGSFVVFYHVINRMRNLMSQGINDFIYGCMLFAVITSAGPSYPFIYFQF